MRISTQHDYVLGHSPAEHQRLARQAKLLVPYTEALLRAAGVRPGMRLLDVGCGVGDVSLLAARLVCPTGEVLGIDQDHDAIVVARQRIQQAGLAQVRFEQAALADFYSSTIFDAIVSRFVLMFSPDPGGAVRSLLRNLRPGGVVIFQEPCWSVFFALSATMPVRRACGLWICEILRRSGADPDMGLDLCRLLEDQGLERPRLMMQVPAIIDNPAVDWLIDLMSTLHHQTDGSSLFAELPCEFGELPERLASEARQTLRWHPMPALAGAWGRTPQSAGGWHVQ